MGWQAGCSSPSISWGKPREETSNSIEVFDLFLPLSHSPICHFPPRYYLSAKPLASFQSLNHHRLFCSGGDGWRREKKSVTSWSTFCSVNQHLKKLSLPSLRKVGRGSQLFWENVTTRPSGADILNMAVRRACLRSSMVLRWRLLLPHTRTWAAGMGSLSLAGTHKLEWCPLPTRSTAPPASQRCVPLVIVSCNISNGCWLWEYQNALQV